MYKRNNVLKFIIILLLFLILILFMILLNKSDYLEINNDNIISQLKTDKDKTFPKVLKSTKDIVEPERFSFNKNVLYVSRHDGTISNFNTVAQLLSFNVTVLEPDYSFEDRPYCFEKDKCRAFVSSVCSQYDYIVVSDIIPDSYIFLTNPCEAKIVLEMTNRFDLFVEDDNRDDYYTRFGEAVMMNNDVTVVENNPFETFFACQNKVFIPNYYLIRPVGYAPPEVLENPVNEIHDEIAIIEHMDQDTNVGIPKLTELGINFKILPHRYGGPLVLSSYKAIVMLPYQVSIMKMMENFRYGVAMLVPSERLFKELMVDDEYEFAEKELADIPDGISNYVEFYNEEFKDLFVYFDKWEDIPEIIETTDFESLKEKVKEYIIQYEEKALNLWAQVLGILPQKDIIKNEQPICDNTDFYNYNNDDDYN